MKLFAISDLHVGHPKNRSGLMEITPHPDDWLILGGDLGETEDHLSFTVDTLGPKFKKLIWVPGNHELYCVKSDKNSLRGAARYEGLVEGLRRRGVITPEDEYPIWEGEGGPHVIAPLFLLYDYSFRPDHVPEHFAVDWAMEEGLLCTDEALLDPHPFVSRSAWCRERVRVTRERLDRTPVLPTVLVNHFPLREDMVRLRFIPRFSIWCGTKLTHDWHVRYRASVVVSGHLHIPRTDWVDGVRFEEVSFGYPRNRPPGRHIDEYLREILPGPPAPRGV